MAIERLSADDRLLLLSDKRWPQDVGAVAVLDGRPLCDGSGTPLVDVAREAVAQGLDGLPRLRQVVRFPARGLGGPFWTDAPDFRLADHVRVGPPLASDDDAALLAAVEQIRSRPLDFRRPLWELWLLPGPRTEHVALFVRMHHVVADGLAGVATLAALLHVRPGEGGRPAAAWSPAPAPSRSELMRDGVRRRGQAARGVLAALGRPRETSAAAAAVWHGIRELVIGEPGPVTSLGGLVGGHRRLALVRAPLDEVQGVAHAQHATVNDALLAVIAAGVRALLSSRGESVDGLVVPVLVPVSLRRGTDPSHVGNRISQMAVGLPVGEADPVERLRRISASTSRAKALPHPSLGVVFRNRLVSAVLLRLVVRRRVNLLSADLIGPAEPLAFAGAPLEEVFPLVNLLGNLTLGVGAMSYAGRFEVLVVADADLHPDLDVFARGAADELGVLAAGVGPVAASREPPGGRWPVG
ncbi:wax ester/triacylglycerol synthase domain-containing protein [Terrabacter sp. BE26]|uniref:wax ester/triacylglycerol synthase domain-containing protein n=1 Tax=Terrabacter sp. BE26 TaxID=2898152 RepID=UPI0035BE5B1E